MKKILLATTALAAVSVASFAHAQESNMMSAGGNTLNIGGYYEFGWATRSDDDTEDDNGGDSFTYGESELFIDFETTSDAGLTYGVQIDLEIVNGNSHGESGGAKNAEESNIYISGDFGTINLGHDDFASDNFMIWAPTHEGTFSQDDVVFYPGANAKEDSAARFVTTPTVDGQPGTGDAPTSQLRHWGNAASYNDASKVTYLSPNFGGFKFGGSFADGQKGDEEYNLGYGASYTHDLSNMMEGASFKLAYGGTTNGEDTERRTTDQTDGDYAINQDNGEVERVNASIGDFVPGKIEDENSSVGASLSLGNLTLTASYYDGQYGDIARDTTEFGIGYVVSDRLSLGYSYATAESEQERTSPNSNIVQEGTFHSASASYSIAPGLKTTLAYNISDITQKGRVDNGTSYGGVSNDSNQVVWQVEFGF